VELKGRRSVTLGAVPQLVSVLFPLLLIDSHLTKDLETVIRAPHHPRSQCPLTPLRPLPGRLPRPFSLNYLNQAAQTALHLSSKKTKMNHFFVSQLLQRAYRSTPAVTQSQSKQCPSLPAIHRYSRPLTRLTLTAG